MLAMLLPMTSIMVWWPRRPETAEKSERSMSGVLPGRFLLASSWTFVSLQRPRRGTNVQLGREVSGWWAGWSGRADLGDRRERHLGGADGEHGPTGAEPDGADDPAGGVTVVRVGHGAADEADRGERLLLGEQLGVLVGHLLELLHHLELRGLAQHLGAVRRVAGVLVLQLRHEQLEEGVAAHGVEAGRGRARARGRAGGGRGGVRTGRADGVGHLGCLTFSGRARRRPPVRWWGGWWVRPGPGSGPAPAGPVAQAAGARCPGRPTRRCRCRPAGLRPAGPGPRAAGAGRAGGRAAGRRRRRRRRAGGWPPRRGAAPRSR